MKLLIVDDEELTREGLLASIDWDRLGITSVLQSDDGIHALSLAKDEKPDIILCDIRMPRMTGIELIEHLESVLPDTSVIFMSGYSDKEYLKAAIKLNAVNYVEKPLDPKEVEEAVIDAKELRLRKLRSRKNEQFYTKETSSLLALSLTRPYREQKEDLSKLLSDLDLKITSGSTFTTFIVKLDTPLQASQVSSFVLQNMRCFLERYHLKCFHVTTYAVHHVFHIFSQGTPSHMVLGEIGQFLAGEFGNLGSYFISRGETFAGISGGYSSYASAVLVLQSSYFFEPNTILCTSSDAYESFDTGAGTAGDPCAKYADALSLEDAEACSSYLDSMYARYAQNLHILPNQVKEVYYKMFLALNDARQKAKLSYNANETIAEHTVLEYLENSFSYQELHLHLCSMTTQFFTDLQNKTPEDSTIFLIKDYIKKNYANDSLSIKEISEHVFLSPSYVCTYFKNQTGTTLNQFLTEFRMETAMQLLSDPRFQIADISSKVGYSNGNYFSKSFKKFTGLSPSQYREKMLG